MPSAPRNTTPAHASWPAVAKARGHDPLAGTWVAAWCAAVYQPAAPTPATFPTGPAYPAPAAQPKPAVGWRDFFSDPKLKAVIDKALANNRDLRVAVANIAAARAQYQVQRAALFPTVSAQAAATYGQEPLNVLEGGAAAPNAAGASGEFNERLFSLTAGVTASTSLARSAT